MNPPLDAQTKPTAWTRQPTSVRPSTLHREAAADPPGVLAPFARCWGCRARRFALRAEGLGITPAWYVTPR